MLVGSLISNAHAWTDDIDFIDDVNKACKFEPNAQCTSAVRVGANLAGIDMNGASMTTMRLDKANLQRAILIQAKLGNVTWVDGRICAEQSVGECL